MHRLIKFSGKTASALQFIDIVVDQSGVNLWIPVRIPAGLESQTSRNLEITVVNVPFLLIGIRSTQNMPRRRRI